MYEVFYSFNFALEKPNYIHISDIYYVHVCTVFSNRKVTVVDKSQELSSYNFDFSFCAYNEFINEKNKYSFKTVVDSEFKIGQTIL